ncbi:hypothetical protein [Microbacterium sp. LMI1-1-1.1]|uniref:hypothetical protein n=1 Tax=Microbacterium sp. LMI1-1-1.1 TaxID=3135223 RepID=UPI003466902A
MPSPIDPDKIPGADILPDVIDENARTIGTISGQVADHGSNVHFAWQGMAGVYEAPESPTLLGLMAPVSAQATQVGDNLSEVSAALIAFAADVRPIKAELDSLRVEAQTFVDSIQGGVQVREINPAWTAAQSPYGGATAMPTYQGSWGSSTTSAPATPDKYRTVTKEWHESQEHVDRNNELLAAVNAQQVKLWEAERACANRIRALFGGAALRAAQSEDDALGYGIAEIPEGTEMPWGAEVERTEGCGEATAKFVFKDFLWEGIAVGGVWGTITGLGTLVLGYNPETGEFFSGDAYGAAWGNLGLIAFSGVANSPLLGPLFASDAAMEATGMGGFLPQEVRDFKAKADEAALNTGKALIAWDKWQDDPGTALGESVFNIGTALIPVGGAAVAGVKTASTAASVVSKMAKVVDFVDPAALAMNGAMRLGGAGLHSLDGLIGRLGSNATDGFHLNTPDTPFIADDATSALRALDDAGVDLGTVTARVEDGIPVYEFPPTAEIPSGRIEMPAGSFDTVRGGDVPVRADGGMSAPVREPELVTAGGVRGETGPAVGNSIVEDAPVRTETSGSGESTVVREPSTETGGGSSHAGGHNGSDGTTGGGVGRGDDGATGGGRSDDGGGPPTNDPTRLPDGDSFEPRMSHDQVIQSPSAESAIESAAARHGLSPDEFHHLIHERPLESLTPEEARVVLDVRESIPMPQPGEVMQKILGQTDVDNLLQHKYGPEDTVGGFVARASDAARLTTPEEIARGFGLDYGPGRTVPDQFTAPIGETYAVRFTLPEGADLRVPSADAGALAGYLFDSSGQPYYRPQRMDPLGPSNPFLGHGFVGDGGIQIIPEYHLPGRIDLELGTEIYRITASGEEIPFVVLTENGWVPV